MDSTTEIEIMKCYTEIKKLRDKIEDYQLAIGKLKDEILIQETNIVYLQGDS